MPTRAATVFPSRSDGPPQSLPRCSTTPLYAATMSASSGEINSLATVSVVDLYKRYLRPGGTDHHYLWASRWLTLFCGALAVGFADVVSTDEVIAVIERSAVMPKAAE